MMLYFGDFKEFLCDSGISNGRFDDVERAFGELIEKQKNRDMCERTSLLSSFQMCGGVGTGGGC